MGDIAIAAGVAVLIGFVGGFISLKTLKLVGVVLTTVVAVVAFLTLVGF